MTTGFTESELLKAFTLPEAQERRLLPAALAKLYDSEVSEVYLTTWLSVLRDSAFASPAFEPLRTPRGGHRRFINSCIAAGLPDAMLKLADIPAPASKVAPVDALMIWRRIVGEASRTRDEAAILNGHLQDVQRVLLRALKSDRFTQRAQAALCLREFTWGPWVKELSNNEIADLMYECLLYASAGHQSVLDELGTRSHAWQKDLMLDTPRHYVDLLSMDEAQAYAPRFWSQSRDDALAAAWGLLFGRNKLTVRRDCLRIIQSKPQIINQLLAIMGVDRTLWHPEAIADATASQILAHLLMVPNLWIPDLAESALAAATTKYLPGSDRKSSNDLKEWIAAVSCWEIFVERPKWRELLTAKWKKIQEETREDILRKFQQAHEYTHSKAHDTGEPKLDDAISNRAICRTCILRILINLTYGKTSTKFVLSTPILLSLLPTAYEASQKVPSEARVARSQRHSNSAHERDAWLRLERTSEAFVSPSRTVYGEKCVACLILPSESILGPVLLFRILRRVHDSFDSHVASWVSLPVNTPNNTYLGQVQQIASLDVLLILMRNVAMIRIPFQKDMGTSRLRQKIAKEDGRIEDDVARAAYLAAAELAVVVDRFDKSAGPERAQWRNLIEKVRKEMVACLGNISEMSSRLGDARNQWWYATHAVSSLEGVDEAQAKTLGWDAASLRAKNQRRLVAASSRISATGSSGA